MLRSKAEAGLSWSKKLSQTESPTSVCPRLQCALEAGSRASMGRGLDVSALVPLAPGPRA